MERWKVYDSEEHENMVMQLAATLLCVVIDETNTSLTTRIYSAVDTAELLFATVKQRSHDANL